MRLIPVDQLATGTTLAQDVMATPGGIPLLRAGVRVTDRYRSALLGAGVTTIWVEDPLSEGVAPTPVISSETRRYAAQAVSRALDKARDALADGLPMPESAVRELTDAASRIVQEVLACPEAAVHLADMMGADQYLLQHVVDVCALGVLAGRRVFEDSGWIDHTGRRRRDGYETRLAKLGLGLLLHDVGKLAIPPHVLNKPGPLDAEEWELMRRHPLIGIDMLGQDTSYLTRAVVRSHHERYDGGGYPDGLTGEDIHQFARIAAVADVYDAVTSERSYKAASAPHVGVEVVCGGEGSAFDPEVVRAFNRVVVPYPPGYGVVLADGRHGVVVGADPDDPLRPTVRAYAEDGSIDTIERAELADAEVSQPA